MKQRHFLPLVCIIKFNKTIILFMPTNCTVTTKVKVSIDLATQLECRVEFIYTPLFTDYP